MFGTQVMDSAGHVNLEILSNFAQGVLDDEAEIDVGWHLCECEPCRKLLDHPELDPRAELRFCVLFESEQERPAYGHAFQRMLSSIALEEPRRRAELGWAPHLIVELLVEVPELRRERIASDSRFHVPGLAEAMLEQADDLMGDDLETAIELGELVLDVLEHTDASCPSALAADLRASAWTLIGDGCRRSERLQEAEEAFGRAFEAIQEGTGEPLAHGQLLDRAARLEGGLKHYERAERLFEEAESSFAAVGEKRRLAGSRVERDRLIQKRGALPDPSILPEGGAARFRASKPKAKRGGRSTVRPVADSSSQPVSATDDELDAAAIVELAIDELLSEGQSLEAARTALELSRLYQSSGHPELARCLTLKMVRSLSADLSEVEIGAFPSGSLKGSETIH